MYARVRNTTTALRRRSGITELHFSLSHLRHIKLQCFCFWPHMRGWENGGRKCERGRGWYGVGWKERNIGAVYAFNFLFFLACNLIPFVFPFYCCFFALVFFFLILARLRAAAIVIVRCTLQRNVTTDELNWTTQRINMVCVCVRVFVA